MKKSRLLFLSLSAVLALGLLAGCGAKEPEETPLSLYAFSGEDDRFSLSSGIIVITDRETVVYGGNLENKGEAFEDVTSFTLRLYVLSDGVEIPLIDVEHITEGGEASLGGLVSGSYGSSRMSYPLSQQEDLAENLYFSLSITHASQEQSQYTIPLSVTKPA